MKKQTIRELWKNFVAASAVLAVVTAGAAVVVHFVQ
jgi:hypothetical protein